MRQTTRSDTNSTLDSATSGSSANTADAQDTTLPVLRRSVLDTVFNDVPLPALRVPSAQITALEEEDDFPLPTLRVARPPSPEPFEPEEEDAIAGTENAYDGVVEDHGAIEGSEVLQNPAASLIAQSLQREQAQRDQEQRGGSTSALTPSTDRPMAAQTARSFESRTGTTIPRASNSNALSRSSTVVTFGDVAPSEAEILSQAGLLGAGKGEKAPERKARQDENDLRIATHIVSILRRIEELDRRSNAQHHEVIIRLEDIQRNAPATASPESLAALQADIAAIKARANEGRTMIAGLTNTVNDLVDLPRDVTNLSRSVRGLESRDTPRESYMNHNFNRDEQRMDRNGPTAPNSAQRDGSSGGGRGNAGTQNAGSGGNGGNRNSMQDGHGGAGSQNNNRGEVDFDRSDDRDETEFRNGGKRSFPPSAGNGGGGGSSKRFKPSEPSYDDVILWTVDTSEMTPTRIAHLAMERLGMNSTNAFISVQQLRNAPKGVISIRFRNSDIADQFIDNFRANAPASMSHLHAARPAVYEKRAMGKSQKDPW